LLSTLEIVVFLNSPQMAKIAQILIACGVSVIPQIGLIPNLWNRACDDITRICGICVSVVDDHLM
jgi:hypothetical protein